MDKLQLSQALMRIQKTTGGQQGGLVIGDMSCSWKVTDLFPEIVNVCPSTAICTVKYPQARQWSPACVFFFCISFIWLWNKLQPHLQWVSNLNYRKCSLSKTLINAMNDINTAHIVSFCSFQFAVPLLCTFLNLILTIPGSSCICSLLSHKESRRVGVIQTFFKLQFIFPEL